MREMLLGFVGRAHQRTFPGKWALASRSGKKQTLQAADLEDSVLPPASPASGPGIGPEPKSGGVGTARESRSLI